MTTTDGRRDAKGIGEYADVNGINLYYETHGAGRPLILLHGGLGSGEMFGPILPTLAEHHQVIAVDLQGHGRTADIDRPIDIRLMADDIAALIDHLGLDKPDVVGYSLGGGVAFFDAVEVPGQGPPARHGLGQHPAATRSTPEMLRAAGPGERGGGRVHEGHADVPALPAGRAAPRGLPAAARQDRRVDGARTSTSARRCAASQVPTLIVAADADMAPPSHYVEVFKLLDGGLRDGGWMGEGRPKGGHALAILPGLTHYDLVSVAAVRRGHPRLPRPSSRAEPPPTSRL